MLFKVDNNYRELLWSNLVYSILAKLGFRKAKPNAMT